MRVNVIRIFTFAFCNQCESGLAMAAIDFQTWPRFKRCSKPFSQSEGYLCSLRAVCKAETYSNLRKLFRPNRTVVFQHHNSAYFGSLFGRPPGSLFSMRSLALIGQSVSRFQQNVFKRTRAERIYRERQGMNTGDRDGLKRTNKCKRLLKILWCIVVVSLWSLAGCH